MALLNPRCLASGRWSPGAARLFTASAAGLQSTYAPSSVAKLLSMSKDSGDRVSPHVAAEAARYGNREKNEVQVEQFKESADRLQTQKANASYLRQMKRAWVSGDVYAPHDLSADEMRKERKNRKSVDVIDLLQINPLDLYKNPVFLADFMTSGGSIMHANLTQLRAVNQRKVAKAIRRAIGLGILPSVHIHPEVLKWEFSNRSNTRLVKGLIQKANTTF